MRIVAYTLYVHICSIIEMGIFFYVSIRPFLRHFFGPDGVAKQWTKNEKIVK